MVKGINPPGELRGLTLWGVKGVIPPGRGVKGVNPPGGLRGLTSQGGCTYDYITLLSSDHFSWGWSAVAPKLILLLSRLDPEGVQVPNHRPTEMPKVDDDDDDDDDDDLESDLYQFGGSCM